MFEDTVSGLQLFDSCVCVASVYLEIEHNIMSYFSEKISKVGGRNQLLFRDA